MQRATVCGSSVFPSLEDLFEISERMADQSATAVSRETAATSTPVVNYGYPHGMVNWLWIGIVDRGVSLLLYCRFSRRLSFRSPTLGATLVSVPLGLT